MSAAAIRQFPFLANENRAMQRALQNTPPRPAEIHAPHVTHTADDAGVDDEIGDDRRAAA